MPRREATDDEWDRGERLGIAIAREREAHRMSQEHLAHSAGLRVDTLRAIEQGRRADPSFFRVVRVIQSLELATERFLFKHGLLDGGRSSKERTHR